MKCFQCYGKWHIHPRLSPVEPTCPFCGSPIRPEQKQFHTAEAVLLEIGRSFGLDALTNSSRLMAYFADLAPLLSQQRRALSYFIQCNGPQKLFQSATLDRQEQNVRVRQLVSLMQNDMLVEQTAAQMICDAFLTAVTDPQVRTVIRTVPTTAPLSQGACAEPEQTPEEQFERAEACYHGTDRIDRNYLQALEWYRKAAVRGHTRAQLQLALMYRTGLGVAPNHKLAFHWFTKAAAVPQPDPKTQLYLGHCYYFGQGIPEDRVQAVTWYRKAAEADEAQAQCSLGSCYEAGHGVVSDNALAFSWYERAARQADPMAQAKLGLLYLTGKGIPKDTEKAHTLFQQAIAQNDAQTLLFLSSRKTFIIEKHFFI